MRISSRKFCCPIHKEEQIFQLRYAQKNPDQEKRSFTTFGTDYYFCKLCKTPFKVEITITKIQDLNID